MSKWSNKFRKMLSAVGISFLIAANAMVMPLGVSAATAVTDGVMIRNEPSTEGGLIGSLNEGDEVTILDVVQSGDGYAWYYIELDNGNTGYVRSDLISASEEELEGFDQAPAQQEEPEEEKTEEKAEEEPAEEKEEKAEPEAEAKAEEETEQAAQDATAEQNPAAQADGYDASKDPNAHFSVKYETEADGSGNWYVYNDDNGSRMKISDMKENGDASGDPGLWKPAAIIFGILTLALAAFVLFLIKSIRDGRSKSSRRRSLEVAGYAPYDEDGEEEEAEEEEEYFFEDDEESVEEVKTPDSTIEAKIPEETEPADLTADNEADAKIGAVTDGLKKAVQDIAGPESDETADGKTGDAEEDTSVEAADAADEPAAETDVKAAEPAPVSEEEGEPAGAQEPAEEEPAEEEPAEEEPAEEIPADEEELPDDEEDIDDEDYADEYEDFADEGELTDDESYDEEEYEEEEDAEDEDYFDDDDDEDYYDDDDDDEPARSSRRRGRRAGEKTGFVGFLKKLFGSDSREDADDDEDFDDEDYREDDEDDDHEFDELSEYPEDADLLPRDDVSDEDFDKDGDFESGGAFKGNAVSDAGKGRLSMQRVMKNVGYKEVENDFSADPDGDESMDDLTDSLFDDDDDMSFSFISNSKKK